MKQKWKEKLVQFRCHITFNQETCAELKQGLQLGSSLELPFDLAFNYLHLSDLLVTRTYLRSFNELRYNNYTLLLCR